MSDRRLDFIISAKDEFTKTFDVAGFKLKQLEGNLKSGFMSPFESQVKANIEGRVRAMSQAADRAKVLSEANRRMFGDPKKEDDSFQGSADTGLFYGPAAKSRFGRDTQEFRKAMADRWRQIREDTRKGQINERVNEYFFGDKTEDAKSAAKKGGKKMAGDVEEGFLHHLGDSFGRGSVLGKWAKLLKGSGPVFAAGIIAHEVDSLATESKDIARLMREPGVAWTEIAVRVGEAVPLFGSIVHAGQSIREIMTGEQAGIDAINRGVEETNRFLTIQEKLTKGVAQNMRDAAERSIQMSERAALAGRTGSTEEVLSRVNQQQREQRDLIELDRKRKEEIRGYESDIIKLKESLNAEKKSALDVSDMRDAAGAFVGKTMKPGTPEYDRAVKYLVDRTFPKGSEGAESAANMGRLEKQIAGLEKLRNGVPGSTLEGDMRDLEGVQSNEMKALILRIGRAHTEDLRTRHLSGFANRVRRGEEKRADFFSTAQDRGQFEDALRQSRIKALEDEVKSGVHNADIELRRAKIAEEFLDRRKDLFGILFSKDAAIAQRLSALMGLSRVGPSAERRSILTDELSRMDLGPRRLAQAGGSRPGDYTLNDAYLASVRNAPNERLVAIEKELQSLNKKLEDGITLVVGNN